MTDVEPGNPSPDPAGRRRVLIVEDETLVSIGIKANLERLGYVVVGQAANSAEATALFRDQQPDIVLMDIRLNSGNGIELAEKLQAERRCPMVILSAYSDQQLVDRASAAGVFGYLIKPVSLESLAAQMAVAVRRFEEQDRLIKEKAQLTATLESRKLIERAKGIYMKRLNLDEPEAHKRLQQESQKRRLSMTDLAKKIIESEELLGG